jgi:hypothetical protein
MDTPAIRHDTLAPNASIDGDIAVLLDRVCAQFPHDYTKQLVRDVVRLKLSMGFEGSVRDYLKRRSGEFPAVAGIVQDSDK